MAAKRRTKKETESIEEIIRTTVGGLIDRLDESESSTNEAYS